MLTLFSSVSCGNKAQADKILILYYSQTGNTRTLAQTIQERLGADIEEIVPLDPYDGSFEETIERGMKEREQGILPEIQAIQSPLEDYDVIFLGYPVWYGTYAPPVAMLLEQLDFKGKKIVPFCTFGSGGLDTSSRDLAGKLADSEVLPGYGVRAARMDAIPAELDRFLKESGFIEGEYVKLDEFPEAHPASEEETAIFDAAMNGYRMIHAKATHATMRNVPGGVEYLFTAESLPREDGAPAGPRQMKVYVLVEEGAEPVFTQIIRP